MLLIFSGNLAVIYEFPDIAKQVEKLALGELLWCVSQEWKLI
jgi:hypothetical protein